MFEVITQANPDDYQSLEILKEAYWKIGRQDEGLAVTRRLADTYMRLGQYSSALLEYEGILQQEPDSTDVRSVLAELEAKLHQGKATNKAPIALDFGIDESDLEEHASGTAVKQPAPPSTPVPAEPTLIATQATKLPRTIIRKHEPNIGLETDGNEPLAKFLIQNRLATHEVVNGALERVRKHNATKDENSQGMAASLLDEISKSGVNIETLLCGIIDRTKFAYVPLESYDVDRQIVKMLPEHLTLGRLIVPFDIVSRTMMVALDNPFDAGAKAAIQQMVDYHILWHVALPGVIQKILQSVYRIS